MINRIYVIDLGQINALNVLTYLHECYIIYTWTRPNLEITGDTR